MNVDKLFYNSVQQRYNVIMGKRFSSGAITNMLTRDVHNKCKNVDENSFLPPRCSVARYKLHVWNQALMNGNIKDLEFHSDDEYRKCCRADGCDCGVNYCVRELRARQNIIELFRI